MNDLIADIRAARTISDIKRLLERPMGTDPSARSLDIYLDRLAARRPEEQFHPGQFLAGDLSAIMWGRCPVIFEGTNKWNEKPYLDADRLNPPVERLVRMLGPRLRQWKGARICIVVIPEKDTVMDKLFGLSGRFNKVDGAISILSSFAKSEGVGFCYDKPLLSRELDGMSEADFTYPDSHLPPQVYALIFARILDELGLSGDDAREHLSFIETNTYSDLAKKFDPPLQPHPFKRDAPTFERADIELIDGMSTFGNPLRTTWQKIRNSSPLIKEKVAVFGDSHSSILSRNMLTHLSAGAFERCDFYWNPLGLRNPEQTTDADFIILEISQRFIF